MRLAVYSDFPYRRDGEASWAEQPFALFLCALEAHVDALSLIGRVDPAAAPESYPYRLPDQVKLVGLPHYQRLSGLRATTGTMGRALGRFWHALADVDCVWLLGPHPLALAFAVLASVRGRRVVLGVRQDLPAYTRRRHPGSRRLLGAALALEAAWRLAARVFAVVVVGPELEARYRGARRLLAIVVSLVAARRLERPVPARDYGERLRVLSVGRLDPEKNPLLLADVLAALRDRDSRYELVVCGVGSEAGALRARLHSLGLTDHAELLGHVPAHAGLDELYEDCHVLLHVSLTEGVPQVLVEAFAAGLPVVATNVGGVAAMAADAALLIEPDDASAAAGAVARVADDAALRARLTSAGRARAGEHTMEAEAGRLARFLAGPALKTPATP